jgi:PAS domain S-box-containing protein
MEQVINDLNVLVENIKEYALFALDAEGRVFSWNKGAAVIFGCAREAIIGKHFSVFYPTEAQERGRAEKDFKTVSAEGRLESENWFVRTDGSRFWGQMVLAAMPDRETGPIQEIVFLMRDLTQQKRAEDELREAAKRLEQSLQERTAELARLTEALSLETAQRKKAEEAIRALSIPVLPLRERIVIVSLVGIIDSSRALQLTEHLLNAIRTYRAKAVVMDITGVPMVDSKVANYLMQAVEASRLMGATVILTGLSSEIAQTLVGLGIDLGGVKTLGDLQEGIDEADKQLGYTVVKAEDRRFYRRRDDLEAGYGPADS